MLFLHDVQFDLDGRGQQLLAKRIEDFLRVGEFTAMEWQSLSTIEQEIAVQVKKSLKLEEYLMLRAALRAESPEDAVALLQSAGDDKAAARVLLQGAVNDLAKGMDSEAFAGSLR